MVSTHSRLKAAGGDVSLLNRLFAVSTHSRLKAAGKLLFLLVIINRFQHTAA